MASDSLLDVIAGLVKRDGETKKEEKKLAKEKMKAEKVKAEKLKAEQEDEEEPEEDEDEAPVGDEEEPEDDGEGDSKPSGPDPTLVAQVAAIVKKEIEDETQAKKETEVKLSGKKEKIDTKPKMEQQRMGRTNFREAIRRSVTGTHLSEGYEEVVLGILEDESIKGPLGYEPFFEKGKLFVMKGQERTAQKALKNSKEISKVPKIVGEEMEAEEYLAMEAVDVDGRC